MIINKLTENKLLLARRCENFGGELKIMHISDIHGSRKGENNSHISDMAEKNKPDLIFITGDLVSRSETDFRSVEILLNRLCAVAPVFMVYGNHEQSLEVNAFRDFSDMLARTKVILLTNSRKNIEVKGKKLCIYGVVQKYTTYKKNDSYKNLDRFTLKDMTDIVGRCLPEKTVLLLAHNPLWAEVYSRWGADYTFSGHVHGGIIRLFGRGLLSPERKFFPKYSKGVYNVGGMKLCVSAGIGKLRLFNPPEIVFYKL